MSSALSGLRVVNTRALHQAAELDQLLLDRGAIPIAFPCIAIEFPDDSTALDQAVRELANGSYEWLLLTSVNAVEALATRLAQLGETLPPGTRIGSVGPATSAAARQLLGIDPEIEPTRQTGFDLASAIPVAAGETVLVPVSDIVRTGGVNLLRQRGARVTVVTAYRTVSGTGGADVPKILRDEGVDALTFCSPSAVTGFVERLGADSRALSFAQSLPTACIGPTTRDTAGANDFNRVECPERHTITDLVTLLEELRFVETAGGSRWL